MLDEPESAAFRGYVESGSVGLVSSRIATTELLRAVKRRGLEWDGLGELLRGVAFREVTAEIAIRAGHLDPADLRSIDAIHLATALELRDELDAFVTYDSRLAGSARDSGLPVTAPA